MLVDDTFYQGRYGYYGLVRIHHIDGHILRVRISRDFYPKQSSAVAEVLTPAHTWTIVATTPFTAWHEATPPTTADGAPLIGIAEALLARAVRILTPPPAGAAPAARAT